MGFSPIQIIAVLLMIFLMVMRRDLYRVSLHKALGVAISAILMGFLGTRTMYFIENGSWVGNSFFGAIFFFPPFLFPVALIFGLKLSELLDYATIPGMLMLCVFKLNCWVSGCCGGRVLYYVGDGVPVFFPSQLAEMVTAFLIFLILLYLEHKHKKPGTIYATCITVYGVCRYVLNWYRWEQSEFVFGMPPGNFWSICAVVIGIVWLTIIHLKKPLPIEQ